MISTCSHCRVPYWRYRGDFPPKGYCSLVCHDARGRREKPVERPETVAAVLDEVRRHRLEVHGTHDALTWFDCPMCELLEARYARTIGAAA